MVISKRAGIVLFVLVTGMLSACSGVSNKIDKSPCACEFELLNHGGNVLMTKPA